MGQELKDVKENEKIKGRRKQESVQENGTRNEEIFYDSHMNIMKNAGEKKKKSVQKGKIVPQLSIAFDDLFYVLATKRSPRPSLPTRNATFLQRHITPSLLLLQILHLISPLHTRSAFLPRCHISGHTYLTVLLSDKQ